VKTKHYSKDPAILTVTRSDGEVLFHSKGKLWRCLGNPNWIEQATRFKTLPHAIKVARKKYSRMLGGYLSSWTVTTAIPKVLTEEMPSYRAEDSESKLSID
jgi:hypothetical protein